MPRVAVISDTHVPDRADGLPAAVEERLRAADHVIHAGDVTDAATVERLRDLAADLVAVAGNMDPRPLGLPTVDTLAAGGVTFVVTHGTGPPSGYEERVADVAREAAGPDAVAVAGHTHEPLDTTVGGVRLLNPGSATGAAPASRATMMTATAGDGDLSIELLDL